MATLFPEVLFIRDLFFPDDVFTVKVAGKYQVGHGRIRCGAVPVIDVGRAPESVAGFDFNDFTIPRSGEAYTFRHDHMLACGMLMPMGSGAGLKGDISPGTVGGIIGGKQHIHLDVTGKQVVRPFEGLLGSGLEYFL